MRVAAAPLICLMALASPAMAAKAATTITQSASGTLTIKISPVFGPVSFTPPSPITNFACGTMSGTLVSTASAAGGDGTTITWTMTGDTSDFALASASGSTTPPITGTTAEVIVGPNGISSANCGMTENVSVTATQN